jgi:transcription elongation GreA/GreB family factor
VIQPIILKEKLLAAVKAIVEQRMQNAWEAMQAAQASANEEGKSSAGDKYETARAMGQLDREMYGRQYQQAQQERAALERIDPDKQPPQITFGSLVQTDTNWYFVAVSVGIVPCDGQKVIVVSPQSPVGQQLMGKTVGDSVLLQGKKTAILGVQ